MNTSKLLRFFHLLFLFFFFSFFSTNLLLSQPVKKIGVNFPFRGPEIGSINYIFSLLSELKPYYIRQMTYADVLWPQVEPTDNNWKFDSSDKVIKNTLGMYTIPTLFQYGASDTIGIQVPWKACSRPNCGWKVTDSIETKDYIKTVVNRYKATQKHWEVGNELEGGRRPKSLPQNELATWAKLCYRWIKEEDPNAVVLNFSLFGTFGYPFDSTLNSFRKYLSFAGKDAFDILPYHDYNSYWTIPLHYDSIKAIMTEFGMANKPIWVTESGISSDPSVTISPKYTSSDGQAADSWRRAALHLVMGSEVFIWHCFFSSTGDWKEFGLLDSRGKKKKSWHSFKLFMDKFESYSSIQKISFGQVTNDNQNGGNGIWVIKFITNEGPKWVMWSPDNKPYILSGLTVNKILVTNIVPITISTDGNTATFNSNTYTVNNGSVSINLNENPVLVEEKPETIPAAPSNLAASASGNFKINLNWQENAANEDGIRVERKTSSGGNWIKLIDLAINTKSYTDSALNDGKQYFYRVCAFNSAGVSAFSNEVNAITQLIAPTELTASPVSSSIIKLNWKEISPNNTGIKIERKKTSDSFQEINQIASPDIFTYSDSGLAANTSYIYRVRTYNSLIQSEYSNEVNAKTSEPPKPISWKSYFTLDPNEGKEFTFDSSGIIYNGAVPGLNISNDGKIILGFSQTNIAGRGAAFTTDTGKTFSILTGLRAPDSPDGGFIYLTDGRTRYLTEVPLSTSTQQKHKSCIISYISEDGLNWTKETGIRYQPGQADDSISSVPSVIQVKDSLWRMYYVGDFYRTNGIRTALSSDWGITWKAESNVNILRNGDVDPNPVYLSNGKIRIYHRRSFNQPGIAYTDGDGLKFDTTTTKTIVQDNAGLTAGKYDPTVIKYPNGKIICYIGTDVKINQNTVSKVIAAIAKPAVPGSVRENINSVINYTLSQNYPNPFNPITTIEFFIPNSGHVNLKVYDALGKEVSILLNENVPAGKHRVEFNGSKFSSGFYIYRLKVGNIILEKSMQMIK